jgi:hypothetical protein
LRGALAADRIHIGENAFTDEQARTTFLMLMLTGLAADALEARMMGTTLYPPEATSDDLSAPEAS